MSRIGNMIQGARNFLAPKNAMPANKPQAGYMRDGRGVTMAGWRPALREAWQDVQQAWSPAAARTVDLMQNVGWIAGGIDQAVADTVGNGLRLNAKPDPAALGLDPNRAAAWAKLAESRFSTWANRPYECDVEGRRNFGQMQAANFRSWFAFGEMVSEFPWRTRPGATYGTKVRLIPPYRLSQKTELMGRLVQGVRMDTDGQPISYVFELPDAYVGRREVEVIARDEYGRPRINHVFDGAIGHVRGISPMVPVLQVARQFDQLANATLMAAIVQSLFAASIESQGPTEDVLGNLLTPEEQAKCAADGISLVDAWFEAQAGWYDKKQIDVGINGRIANLFPGQKLEFKASQTPGPNHKDFATSLLRENARCMGITYEGMTGDYAGVTFSSIRFATDNIWRIVQNRRKFLVSPFCQAGYEAWLEEEIDNGGPLTIPGGLQKFLDNRAGICNAEWKGSPKPTADEVKSATAQQMKLAMGVMSEYAIAAENGEDYDDVCAERAQAAKLRNGLGLPDPILTKAAPPSEPESQDDTGGLVQPEKSKEPA